DASGSAARGSGMGRGAGRTGGVVSTRRAGSNTGSADVAATETVARRAIRSSFGGGSGFFKPPPPPPPPGPGSARKTSRVGGGAAEEEGLAHTDAQPHHQ